jgi:hypothetical protein
MNIELYNCLIILPHQGWGMDSLLTGGAAVTVLPRSPADPRAWGLARTYAELPTTGRDICLQGTVGETSYIHDIYIVTRTHSNISFVNCSFALFLSFFFLLLLWSMHVVFERSL